MWTEILFCCFTLLFPSGEGDPAKSSASPEATSRSAALPDAVGQAQPSGGIEWRGLTESSLRFIGVMHAFRLATEPGTRAAGIGWGAGYTRSIRALHGWADGDPFYVNYVGHPMQGAVSGYLFQLHDRRYKRVEFGRGRDYWKARLRGAAFSWAFSEQFEIGPLSEATIGHIQRDFPQQGFADHVVTPAIGLAWTIGEDALDRYLVRPIELKSGNRWVRIFARSFLNPARSFANLMDEKVPWYRDSRAGILSYRSIPGDNSMDTPVPATTDSAPDVAPLEFAPISGWRSFGDKGCAGGGAEAAWRVDTDWQIVLAVNGCKMAGLQTNVSGDAWIYQVGPRWTPSPAGKWSPYAHLLLGGIKATQERLDLAKKRAVMAANQALDPSLDYTLHEQYTTSDDANAFALTAGVGVDYELNSALAFRVANLEYLRSQLPVMGGVSYTHGFQMSTGLVLRIGTW
jgi:hypothetical protein